MRRIADSRGKSLAGYTQMPNYTGAWGIYAAHQMALQAAPVQAAETSGSPFFLHSLPLAQASDAVVRQFYERGAIPRYRIMPLTL